MKRHNALILALSSVAPLIAQDIPSKRIEFEKGSSSATLKAKLTGHKNFDYRLAAKAGQTLSVTLEAGTPSLCFNILPPNDGEPLRVGSTSDTSSFTGKLHADGDYTIRLYLMGNANAINLTVPYTLKTSIDGKAASPAAGFDKTLKLQGVTFHIRTAAGADGKTVLTVTPKGLEKDNSPVVAKIKNTVTGAEVADLDADGSPEIYVYTQGKGKLAKGKVRAWSSNKKRSLSSIHLPSLAKDAANSSGYTGHDEFTVLENALGRRFPIKGGKTRQIQYKLVPGEASWQLKIDKVSEF
ncbi:MAG: hypothetical protein V4640_06900 [Verrucomicrobiota bacterium]